LFYQRPPVEEREKISGRYTLLCIYILFVVVGTAAAALIGEQFEAFVQCIDLLNLSFYSSALD
jgi:hypothetical protein